jgi:membrane-bound ClpP family serine protease
MIDPTQIFDLWDIFVNELVGDVVLAVVLGALLVAIFSAKFKLPAEVGTILLMLFLAIMFKESQLFLLWVLIVLVAGILGYYIISRIIDR